MRQNDPLQRLREITEAEASRRATERAANRARFPELAAITDRYPHMKLIWAKDANGEIGKDRKFPGVEVDARIAELMAWGKEGKRK